MDVGLIAAAAGEVSGALGEPAQRNLLAAREAQALSFVFHIPLVCFGIAFPAMVLFAEALWLRTGDVVYKSIAKRWSKVMLVLFAVGVVTGTILSFELGLLWPNFMATFGDVFGVAFALEGFSFFCEAIFIAIYVYGWDRLSPRAHFAVGVPILVAGLAGSLFVISVNGWMNDPGGFTVSAGEVVDVEPWAALTSSHLPYELTHMYLAGYIVAGFVVAAVYARGWLRGRRDRYQRAAMIIPLTFAALATPAQLVVGDWAARTVADDQPTKLAAFEGLTETTSGAPFTLGGIYDDGEVKYGITIPKLLSLLAEHDPEATIEGLDAVPAADRPPVNVVRIAFQTMVSIGVALAALSAVYLVTWWRRRRLPRSVWFYRALVLAAPLSIVALISGWVTTEVGRQPWIVYETMRTESAVTEAGGLWLVFGGLAAVYLSLLVGVIWLLRRLAGRPIADEAEELAAA